MKKSIISILAVLGAFALVITLALVWPTNTKIQTKVRKAVVSHILNIGCGPGATRLVINGPCEQVVYKSKSSSPRALLPALASDVPPQLCYTVAAVNGVGIGPQSNEQCINAQLPGFKAFVSNVQASSPYLTWAKANPKDLAKWKIFRDAIINGGTPVVPSMGTRFGRALTEAGELSLH